jgi:hypothetical protein
LISFERSVRADDLKVIVASGSSPSRGARARRIYPVIDALDSLELPVSPRMRRAARQASTSTAQNLAGPATALLMAPAWQELDQLRGEHYHRRRPQSAGIAGVPLASPWRFTSDASHMDGGGGQYTDGDGLAHDTTDLVRRALGELTSAMARLLVQVKTVVQERKSPSS